MYSSSLLIVLLCLTKATLSAPIDEENYVELLDSFQSRGDEAFEFKYELSDGQMREETIHYDDLDRGIAIRGSYKIELENGEMQTIYYISDSRGHRISINVPFPEGDEFNRPPPTRKPQVKKFEAKTEELKSFEENRIDGTRKGKVQEQPVQPIGGVRARKFETSKRPITTTTKKASEVKEEVKEPEENVEEAKSEEKEQNEEEKQETEQGDDESAAEENDDQ